jgi:hypothetical protein
MAIAKSDCLTTDEAIRELSISKPTLYDYVRHLSIVSHKFPFDRKAYYLKSDVERIRQLIAEIRRQ